MLQHKTAPTGKKALPTHPCSLAVEAVQLRHGVGAGVSMMLPHRSEEEAMVRGC
jgi:hypothetical protein